MRKQKQEKLNKKSKNTWNKMTKIYVAEKNGGIKRFKVTKHKHERNEEERDKIRRRKSRKWKQQRRE